MTEHNTDERSSVREQDRVKHCLDLFAGLGGWTQAFVGRPDWEVTRVDMSETFDRKLWLDAWGFETLTVESEVSQDIVADLRDLSWRDFGTDYDLITAGPPCPGFSMMNVGDNWTDGRPVTESARESVELMFKTYELVETLSPKFYAIENPRGMAGDYLREFAERVDFVTQCQYGKRWQKATYIAHNIPTFDGERCPRGARCHVPAPRGSDSGVQSERVTSADRATIPRGLSEAVRDAVDASLSGADRQATLEEVVA